MHTTRTGRGSQGGLGLQVSRKTCRDTQRPAPTRLGAQARCPGVGKQKRRGSWEAEAVRPAAGRQALDPPRGEGQKARKRVAALALREADVVSMKASAFLATAHDQE